MSGVSEPGWSGSRFARTSFVGRAAEVDDVTHLLEGSRLVTLVGPPGAGKTRLAAEVGQRLVETFARGVVPVALARVSDGADLTGAVAAALGVRQHSGTGLEDSVLAAVDERDRDLLAVRRGELLGAGDVDLVVRRADLGADPGDHLARVVAEVATGPRVEHHPGPALGRVHSSSPIARRRSCARRRPFCTLPVTV